MSATDGGGATSHERDGDWLLGVDAGLTKVKVALFTPDGDEVAVESRDTPTAEPARDRHEVDLGDLWRVVGEAVRDVVASGPAAADGIAAVGVTGHGHGLYLLDAAGEPVRPGIRSTDGRATGLVEEWEDDGLAAEVRELLGYEPFAGDPLSLLGWLRRNEPSAYDDIDTLLFCKDFLKYRLTDRVCTDEMEASVFYDPERNEPAAEVFDVLGLGEMAEALPDVVPSWEACGEVTETAAEATGLEPGTPVASGLHDVGAVALGSGAHDALQGVLIVGTWGQSIVVLDSPTAGADTTAPSGGSGNDGPRREGLTRRYLEDCWLHYKGNRSAAACLDWFVEEFGSEWRRRAANEGTDPYAIYDRVVDDVPAGAEGLLFHPYLHGSTDHPGASGGFLGLRATHTKEHMLRAIYEGIAMSQVERLAELEPATGLADLYLGGGGARSEVWADMFADVRGDELGVPAGREAGARGAAICAAIAAGIHPDHSTAVDRMVSQARSHEPTPELASVYAERRELFEETVAAIEPTWNQLATNQQRSDTNE